MARKTHASAADAQKAILDAAEEAVLEGGPQGLRLSDVANRAGMTHSNIIHHFGSRQGLLESLSQRVSDQFTKRISRAIEEAFHAEEKDWGQAMQRVLQQVYAGSAGKIAVWLHMSGVNNPLDENMHRIVALAHQLRTRINQDKNTELSLSYTRRLVQLVTLALIGEVVAGESMSKALASDDGKIEKEDFRIWLSHFVLSSSTSELDFNAEAEINHESSNG